MLIKLQPDQISLFWDMIREGMIRSNRIPDKYSQDYSIDLLKQCLVGDIQCWLDYEEVDGTKNVRYFVATQIIEAKYLGLRSLYIVGFYSLVSVTRETITEMCEAIRPYAIANNCQVAMADYYTERVKGILLDCGFEPYKSTARIFLGGDQ